MWQIDLLEYHLILQRNEIDSMPHMKFENVCQGKESAQKVTYRDMSRTGNHRDRK